MSIAAQILLFLLNQADFMDPLCLITPWRLMQIEIVYDYGKEEAELVWYSPMKWIKGRIFTHLRFSILSSCLSPLLLPPPQQLKRTPQPPVKLVEENSGLSFGKFWASKLLSANWAYTTSVLVSIITLNMSMNKNWTTSMTLVRIYICKFCHLSE